MVVGFHLLTHVVVLVLEVQLYGAFSVFGVDEIGHLGHHFLTGLELLTVMVTDDVGEVCLLHRALEGDEMEEALVALRVFRAGHNGKHGIEFLADKDGIFHLALGIAGVDVAALDMDFGTCRVEVLKLKLSNLAAVHGVGVVCAKALDVKLHNAAADFFVRGKTYPDGPVLEFRVLHNILDGVHDFCNAGLVIGPKKGCSVCCDKGLADIMEHFREFRGLQFQAGNAIEGNCAAVVVLHNLRLDICA